MCVCDLRCARLPVVKRGMKFGAKEAVVKEKPAGGNQRAFMFVAVKNPLYCVSLVSGEGLESVVLQ